MTDIQTFREEIDALDEELIKILGKRSNIVRKVAAYKSNTGVAVMQPDRIQQIKDRCTRLGKTYGVRPEFLHKLYDLIIEESCYLEDELINPPRS